MIYITGDTHGELRAILSERQKPDGTGWTHEDKEIICGDFGFVMRADRLENGCYADEWKLNELEGCPQEILFVSGNHENFDRLYAYPDEERYGGLVKRIRKNIFLLKRGEIYTIEGKTFFTFGGAYSIDRSLRVERVSWWPQELPSPQEYRHAIDRLEKYHKCVDYILTHNAPDRVVMQIIPQADRHDAELTGFLDWVMTEVTFQQWFFGHWHIDKSFYDGKMVACYEQVHRLAAEIHFPC